MKNENKIRGGLYGLLVGDALGVPYEFYPANSIPPLDKIEMEPPLGFQRSHSGVKPGTWSDDGAQALCLLDSLLEKGSFDLADFSERMLAWYEEGLWAVDNVVFDVGIQTSMALSEFKAGTAPEKCGNVRPEGKGNGALMRVLPLALWHEGSNEQLVYDAHAQCLITHGHITNQVCCALYCLIARQLLNGCDFELALKNAAAELRLIYIKMPEYSEELEFRLMQEGFSSWAGKGSGYVVDSLKSAVMIMSRAKSYEQAVKLAVALGDDTDTTACITGGLAGIMFGYEGIPERWIDLLRNKKAVEGLLDKLLG